MKTYTLERGLSIIDVAPPIRGFEQFISIYVLEAGKVALVDVGPSVSVVNLVAGLQQLKVSPGDVSYVFISHIHLDHAGGIGRVLKQIPNANVVVHEKGAPHLIDPTKLWADSQRALGEVAEKYEPLEPVPEDRVIVGRDGMVFDLGGMKLEVLETPGHASHHLSFWDNQKKRLFVGEAAGVYTAEVDLTRPGTPAPFNLEQSLESLDRLIQLAPVSLCYGHFGCAPQPLDRLRTAKQQLILWSKIIAACVEEGLSIEDMYPRIREADAMLARLDGILADRRDRELYFIDNSIKGLVGYFEKFGTGLVKQL
ncbi:MBL fold metallo-hydrolase [Chloroflexota bacterium]